MLKLQIEGYAQELTDGTWIAHIGQSSHTVADVSAAFACLKDEAQTIQLTYLAPQPRVHIIHAPKPRTSPAPVTARPAILSPLISAQKKSTPAATPPVPLEYSTNFAYDTPGTPDTRPGTWGNAAYVDIPVVFTMPPAGSAGVITARIRGTHQGWAHGVVPSGTNAGILFGLLVEGAGQSPYVAAGLGSSGCPIYLQTQVGQDGATVEFNEDLGQMPLGQDLTLTTRLAVFLNDTGQSIHQEASYVLEFSY